MPLTFSALARRAVSWPAGSPRRALALAFAFLAVSLAGATHIVIDADVTTGFDSPAARALDRVRSDLGVGEELFVLVEATDDRGLPHVDRFAAALAADLAHDPAFAPRGAGLDLERILDVVPDVGAAFLAPDEARAWAAPSREFLDLRIAAAVARADLPGLGTGDRLLELDPLGLGGPVLARLGAGGLPATMASGAMRSPGGRAVLLPVSVRGSSSDPASARAAIDGTQRAIAAHAQDPGAGYLACHIAGGHAIAVESEEIVRRDLVITLSSSLLLSLAMVGYGFSVGFRGALLLAIPVVWGTVVGVGVHGFLQPGGRIPAMALACAGVLIGLGIDFAIHAVGEAAARESKALEEVWPRLAGRLGLTALTSTAAFAAFGLAAQPALRVMGAIAVTGLVACWLGAVLLMPAVLGTTPFRNVRARNLGAIGVAGAARRYPLSALGAIAAVSAAAACAVALHPPSFERDLSRMHARDSRALLAQRRIALHFGRAADPLLLVLTARDELAAFAACHRLEPVLRSLRVGGKIAGHFSAAHLLPSREAQGEAARAFAGDLSTLAARAALATAIASALDANGLDALSYATYVNRWVDALARLDVPISPAQLNATPLGPLTSSVLRPTEGGATAIVVVVPSAPLWDERERTTLVADLETALATCGARGSVTGMNVIAAEAADLVAADLRDVSVATVATVVAILLIHFRRPSRVAFVLLPATLATLWTAGLLAATGLRLNMMNMGVLPLVLAIGVDDGIHVVDHWLAGGARGIKNVVAHTGTAVMLTSATTMVSFGSLACSELRGLASVGWIVLFGVGAALAATLVALPAVLTLAEPPDDAQGSQLAVDAVHGLR